MFIIIDTTILLDVSVSSNVENFLFFFDNATKEESTRKEGSPVIITYLQVKNVMLYFNCPSEHGELADGAEEYDTVKKGFQGNIKAEGESQI